MAEQASVLLGNRVCQHLSSQQGIF